MDTHGGARKSQYGCFIFYISSFHQLFNVILYVVIAIGGALPLLASPVAWLHYHVLAIPLLLYMLRPIEADEDRAWRCIRFILGTFALLMMCTSELVTNWLWLADDQSRARRVKGNAKNPPARGGVSNLTPSAETRRARLLVRPSTARLAGNALTRAGRHVVSAAHRIVG